MKNSQRMYRKWFCFTALVFLLLAVPATASANLVYDDFQSDTGLWQYYNGVYRAQEGYVVLTPAVNGWSNSYMTTLEPVKLPFTFHFRYKAGGGSGADGIFISFGNGYGVEFDNFPNYGFVGDPSANHIAITGNGKHLKYVNDKRTEDFIWHDVKLQVNSGSVDIYMDGDLLLTWQGEMPQPTISMVIQGYTGALNNWHLLDDVFLLDNNPVKKEITQGSTLDFPVSELTTLVNGNSVNGLVVSSVSRSADTHGTVSLENGMVKYIPEAGYTGLASFKYTLTDSRNRQAIGIVNVNVKTNPDSIPPITTAALPNPGGLDGWYLSNVVVGLTAADNEGGSGVNRTEYRVNEGGWLAYTAPFTVSTNGISTVYYRSVDNAGNIESTKTVSLKIDKIAPVTNVVLDGTLGNNGWYVSDVKVTMTASDNQDGSGVAKTEYSMDGTNWTTYTEPFILDAEGATTLYYRSYDNACNIETAQQEENINVDVTAPTTAAVFNRPSGNGEWGNESGQVTLNVNDTGSGGGRTEYSFDGENWIPYDGPINIDEEGTHTIYYRSEDGAGNKEAAKKIVIKIDKTPPVITGEATTAPNDNGWYKNDVTVRFTATDAVSGIDTVTPDITITTEGVDQSVTGTAKDKAGNTASYAVTGINIDKTMPEITIDLPSEGAEYILGQSVIANWSASDSLSGMDSAVGTVASGEAIDTATVGLKTFTVVAKDKAGNKTEKTIFYRVVYTVEINLKSSEGKTHKLGSTIPVKFTLKDANGSLVTNASAELYAAKIEDGKAGEEQKASSTSSAASGNLFRYDNTDGQYIFNLSTKELSAGTWQLRIALGDNTSINFTVVLR